MPLSPEEKDQALALAKGMLMAQKDSVSLAGNLVNNPHFTNVPHPVKLEALRQYALLENEGPYRTTVNIEPDKKEVAKQVAKAALTEGLVSLPLHAAIGYGISTLDRNPMTGSYGPGSSYLTAKAKGLTSKKALLKRLAPITAAIFAANAAVGGTRELLHQKAKLQEARAANQYLNKIRDTSSDEDLNAMLLGAATKQDAITSTLNKHLKTIDQATTVGSVMGAPILSDETLRNPLASYPASKAFEVGEELERDIERYDRAMLMNKNAAESTSLYAPPKAPNKYRGGNLRNTASSPSFKAKSVKIRKEQMESYNQAAKHGLMDDHDAQYRLGKAMAKKFLRL